MKESKILKTAFLAIIFVVTLSCLGRCLQKCTVADETKATDNDEIWVSTNEPGTQATLWIKWFKVNFRYCPPGNFTKSINGKSYTVTLKQGFWLAESETTQEIYEAVVGENDSEEKSKLNPVTDMHLKNIQKFISIINEKGYAPEGFEFQLPTEAQWEYACMAGTTNKEHYGELDTVAWYKDNAGGTHEVCTKEPNAWGLYDMLGNVRECCCGLYQDHFVSEENNQKSDVGKSICALRGGGFKDDGSKCAHSYYELRDGWIDFDDVGFRIALTRKGLEKLEELEEINKQTPEVRSEPPTKEALAWAESSERKAGTRKTLKLGNAEYGFCWIPAGEFDMGSPATEKDREACEELHRVKLTKGFWMLETEVTQGLYKEVMGTNPSSFSRGNPLLPVECVTRNDAIEFCETLKYRLPKGLKPSLPTEAQWEYACRAGTKTAYSYGNAADPRWMNYYDASPTTPVKSYGKNRWGLYDMHGNVSEFVQDRYGDYPRGLSVDPQGSSDGSDYVCRGGSWADNAAHCRSATRLWASSDENARNIGFRIVLTCEELNGQPSENTIGGQTEEALDSTKKTSVPPSKEESAWSESSKRKAGTRKTLKFGNEEYGFCWIPAGEFEMGSLGFEKDRDDYEELHHVKLTKGFWILETEVTQELYQEVMGTNPSLFKGERSRFKENNLPVEEITWDDAMKFSEELTKRLPKGLNATLPTEAQWEYACRAGTTTPFSFGDSLNGDKANCNGHYPYGTNEEGRDVEQTTPVKSYPANPWGLYDMHGNVSEWTSDRYELYTSKSATDPTGPNVGTKHVYRGGSWSNGAARCRSAYRTNHEQHVKTNNIGFRVVLTCEGSY